MTRELIQLDLIDANPWQPRTSDDPEHISNLAVSIAKDGLLQPPAARLMPDGRYQLAFGHSRCKAFQYLCLMAETDQGWLTDHGIEASVEQFAAMPLEIATLDDEAMYRHAISENVQRKDLSPIEEATAMKRAMDDFGYDSEKVGALFGKAGGTVRGMIRLLDLPQEAQEMLGRGEISQNAARALLSMQRVVPESVVVETAVSIKEKAADATPENVVSNAIEYRKGVIVLWRDRNEGKPRAGGRKGWVLDMKNFPNKLLPEMDKNDIANFIPSIMGVVDTRMLKYLTKAEDVGAFLLLLDESGTPEDLALLKAIEHLIYPSACSACPFYTKIGGTHYCGLRACYERKEVAWRQERMQATSRDNGIAIYQKTDGAHFVLDAYSDKHEALFKEKNAGLRLIDRREVKGYPSQYKWNTSGIDEDFVIVLVGKALDDLKAAQKQERAEKKAGQAGNNIWDLRGQKVSLFKWEATVYFESLFENLTLGAIDALSRRMYDSVEQPPAGTEPKTDADDDVQASYLRRKVLLNMLRIFRVFETGTVVEAAEWLLFAAEKCGVTVPAVHFMETAQAIDAEIDAQFPPKDAAAPTLATDEDEDDNDDGFYDEDEDLEAETELE